MRATNEMAGAHTRPPCCGTRLKRTVLDQLTGHSEAPPPVQTLVNCAPSRPLVSFRVRDVRSLGAFVAPRPVDLASIFGFPRDSIDRGLNRARHHRASHHPMAGRGPCWTGPAPGDQVRRRPPKPRLAGPVHARHGARMSRPAGGGGERPGRGPRCLGPVRGDTTVRTSLCPQLLGLAPPHAAQTRTPWRPGQLPAGGHVHTLSLIHI